MHKFILITVTFIAFIFSFLATADSNDSVNGGVVLKETIGNKIKCKPSIAYFCTPSSCTTVEIIDLYTSQFLEIDLSSNTISGSLGENTIDIKYTSKDNSNNEALIFSGSHQRSASFYDWIIRVDKKSGKMTLTSISNEASNTIFGECQW